MKINKLISIGKALAIAVLILGIIHDIATFTPIIKYGLTCLDILNLNAVIYMSLVCGTSLILSGLLIYIQLAKIQENTVLVFPTLIIGIFLAITGIFSIVFMFNNPFAWIALVLNISIFTVILKIRNVLFRD